MSHAAVSHGHGADDHAAHGSLKAYVVGFALSGPAPIRDITEYADKTLALGDKIEPPVKYQAYYARAFAFTNIQPTPTDPDCPM